MNGMQRIEAALRGEQPDRTPVMLHNFLMAAREAGYTQRQYREDPQAIAASFIRAVETYDYDGVVVDVDTATLAGALGVPVDFPEDEPARYHGAVLTDLATRPPAVALQQDRRVQIWLEATRLLKRHFGDAVLVRGNCDQCPFSLAGSLRGAADWMMDLMDEEQHPAAERLLAFCTEVTAQFLRLMAEAGADMLSNGDSPAGPDVVSPDLYRRFAQPWETRIAAVAHGVGKPYLLHICGNTNRILADMAATGADALELDYKTDVRAARAAFQGRVTFVGNIDPSGVLCLGTPALVEQKTRELLAVFAGEPRFILNAGCAIPSTTPPENLRAMLRAARSA
jgi:MtaA/CmuA family methyltransferase